MKFLIEITRSPEENAQAIVKRHIALLHEYNETKDATQALIGRVSYGLLSQ
jgi:hypothetical protein